MDTALNRLVSELKRMPGIGEKTATRLAHFILRQPPDFAESLAQSLMSAREQLHACAHCCNFSETPVCPICSNPERSDEVLCVVEEPSDVIAFEKSHSFSGKYHVLHGVISPLDGIDERRLRIKELQERLRAGKIQEVILATNPTVEGEATAYFITEQLRGAGVAVSRIAHGVPLGGELEYVDGGTLQHAFQGRKPV